MTKEKETIIIFYMPLAGDPAKTICHGIEFTAYEPTEVPAHKAGGHHFTTNPWFGVEIDDGRQEIWDKHRKAHADFAKAKDAIEAHEKTLKGEG